jgi:CRISPR-associated protein Cas5d
VERGGRRDIFLGTRECQAYVEPCEFLKGAGFYAGYGSIDFGMMFHGFDYPDETGVNQLVVRWWRQQMKDGVIEFIAPKDVPPEFKRTIREYSADYSFKHFEEGVNFELV